MNWVSAHRKQVMVVAGLLVVALVAALVLVQVLKPGPKDIVEDYLNAIHDGDIHTAMAIAGQQEAAGQPAFLSSAALADDWTVDSVVERRRANTSAYIDFTLSAGNTSRQGRFTVVRDNSTSAWRIEEPFVQVEFHTAGLDFVELGGIRRSAADGSVLLVLFPGVYEVYPGLTDKQVIRDQEKLVALPTGSTLSHTANLTLTEAGAREGQRAINAYIDTCARKTEEAPEGCPFNAGEVYGVLGDPTDIIWKVVSYPEARFITDSNGFRAIVRKPGTITVSATATPYEPEGSPRTTITGTCEFGFEDMNIELDETGITVGGGDDDYSGSQCYQ